MHNNAYTCSIFVVDNEHANHGSQCSSVPTYALVVHNVALYLPIGWCTRQFCMLVMDYS